MICPKCGNENPPKLKFCVNCGTNLENPQEINYEQVDLGHYHSEEESKSGGFRFGSGTFKISDTAPVSSSSDLYTADELNDDDEEFDFSSFDEPFIPKLDTGRVTLPQASEPKQNQNVRQPQMNPQPPMGGMPQMYGQPPMGGMPQMNGQPPMGGMPQMNGQPPMGGMPQMNGQPPMGGMPQMNGQPPMGGMPQMNGQPPMGGMPQMYGQPMMYAQPQIIGYDQNGTPIYGQPMMYPQPQIIGYDQNGMPIYGQPMMFQQPVMGENGEFVQQPVMPVGGISPMINPNAPQNPFAQNIQQPEPEPEPEPPKEDKRVEVPDDFWAFFDGGKQTEHAEPADDFFGKHNMGSVSTKGIDASSIKPHERKKKDYMSDTPLVDAAKLAPNTEAKFNKFYMKQTAESKSADLQSRERKAKNMMSGTKHVNSSDLEAGKAKTHEDVSMVMADEADASELEAYVPEHTEAIMAQAVKSEKKSPKKKGYVSELDEIELPDYMQAKKTKKADKEKIPGLPEI